MTAWRLGWRQFRRHLSAGEIRLLLAALVLAVFGVGSIQLLTDRAERALQLQANQLLGGDLVLRGDAPIGDEPRSAARALGLQQAETLALSSMVRAASDLRLGELRALGAGFPLRGAFQLDDGQREFAANGVPAAGTVWLGQAGARTLGVRVGESVSIGERDFVVAALVTQEPDAAMDYFNVAPRVFLNLSDLPSTGLMQPGSRITHRLIVAGQEAGIRDFARTVGTNLPRGQRLEFARDGRPEIRVALDRASRFLGLVAVLSVVLAAAAMAMAARQHSRRQVDAFAVMRCLGASERTLRIVTLGELLLLALVGSGVGAALAWVAALLLGNALEPLLGMALPAPRIESLAMAFSVGVLSVAVVAAPPLLALRRVPALRVLRGDVAWREASAWAWGALAFTGLAGLLWWQADSAALGGGLLVGIGLTLLALGSLAAAMVWLVGRSRLALRGPWRLGLANLGRRPAVAVAQTTALGLGLMALLLLTFVRTELLERWRASVPTDAPNRFLVNVQPDQLDGVRRFLAGEGLAEPVLWPMIRGRYTALNGEPMSSQRYAGDGQRARRLAEREFNLSTATALDASNTVIEGDFWAPDSDARELSVEQGLAEALRWKLGDEVSFDVAGTPLRATITSIREVRWESFSPNFFVLVSPAAARDLPASYITAVHLPKGNQGFSRRLLDAFPNLSVVDIDAILAQVTSIADQVSRVIEAVFLLSVAAGVLVLLAAVQASQEERLREGAVMRVLGGTRAQLRWSQAAEFGAIGLVAGGVATLAAAALSWVVAERLDLPFQADWAMFLTGGVAGVAVAMGSGLLATRKVASIPPNVVLRGL